MPIRITNAKTEDRLLNRVTDLSGIAVDTCLQCRKCSNGCPVARHSDSSPSEIIRLLQLHADSRVLDLDMIWACASCETCYGRCPMKINMADVMDSLRVVAVEKGAKKPAGNMPLMNRLLTGTMNRFGRTYDLAAMMLYKAGTFTYLRDTSKFPMILSKGKIALLPPRGADTKTVRRIFKKLKSARKK